MPKTIELGLDTFGDVTRDSAGRLLSQAEVIRNVVAEGILADQVGLDFFGLGEHHREDFAISAPDVILAAIAAKTKRIHLGSAVTVLSSDDPIRVFQRFSTLDALSSGRAEVILGRGSFTESFPLFGFDLKDYETLFDEKLDLFAALVKQGPVTWQGSTRPPLLKQSVFPPVENGRLKVWIGVGGSPQSVVRAAHYGFPLALAIIGGDPARFLPFVDLYHRACEQMKIETPPVGIHSHGYVAETDEQAREELWPDYRVMRDRIGKERGWPPMQRAEFDNEASNGSLYCGSPETVARRIARTIRTLNANRFEIKYSAGHLPHDKMMKSIELYGTKVVPMVRELVAAGATAEA